MSRRLKLTLIILVLLVLLAALVVVLLSRVDATSRFKAVVSEATGLEVAVNGNVSIGTVSESACGAEGSDSEE